jgi:hypothetical protein
MEDVNKIHRKINVVKKGLEAAVGFEPTNKGFADLRLGPLGYTALKKTTPFYRG